MHENLLEIIDEVRAHPRRLDQYDHLSTSEWLIVCLGVGTKASFTQMARRGGATIPTAWARIGAGGQAIVLEAWGTAA